MATRIHHVNIPAHNVREVAQFYEEVLQFPEASMPRKAGLEQPSREQIAWFDPGDGGTQLHLALPRAEFAHDNNIFVNPITHGHVAFTVDDIEYVKTKLDERGVYYADLGNWAVKGLYQIYTTDPDGNVVEINQKID